MEYPVLEQDSDYVNLQDIQMDENGEIHYIQCEDNEVLLGENNEVDLTNLVLEDGTQAMLVNGTLFTANGETILLQDDDSDLAQFMVNENEDEIIISQNSDEQQYLQIMSSDDTQGHCSDSLDVNNQQQMLYLQDTHMFFPISDSNLQQEENMPNETEAVIDLEQMLRHQSVTHMQNNYQYAVLKDGKFHLQLIDLESAELSHLLNVNNEDAILTNEGAPINSNESELDLSEIKGRNMKTGQVITLCKYIDKNLSNKKREMITKLSCNNGKTPQLVNNNLRKLINKKIPLGCTNEGKKLVGKIINVMSKPRELKSTKINNPQNQINTTSEPAKSRINLLSKKVKKVNTYSKQKSRSTSDIIQSAEKVESVVETNFKKIDDIQKSISNEPSKVIIIHEKTVSKDCFATISKTLTGLMNMESVVKKLKNRIIIIKIVEKTLDESTGNFTKTVSYCSGFMEREVMKKEEGNFIETWKFVPDSNSRKTILGHQNVEQGGEQEPQPNYTKYASLTIEITRNKYNQIIPRVIINPSALYQCKVCPKGFQTSTLMKLHMMQNHPQDSFSFESEKTNKRPAATENVVPEKRGMFECSKCNEKFFTSANIRKHMELHYILMPCSICNKNLASSAEMKKHMQMHSKLGESISEQDNTRKVLSCQICSRQFSRYSNLQRHIEIHKGEGAMYQCGVCSCSYHYISSLTRHVVSCHLWIR